MAKSTIARYTQEFKFEAVRLVKGGQGLAVTAKILGISDQTLHNGIKADRQGRLKGSEAKPVSTEQMEIARLPDAAVLVHIRAAQRESKGEYGWPRAWRHLQQDRVRVGKERVRKLMQQHGIRARGTRKFIATTDSRHNLPVAENLLDRKFSPAAPDQVWVSDITYIATDEGWLYLAAVIDLYSRQVVGWSMQPHMKTQRVSDALRMAWLPRHPAAGLIFHSDRGSQWGKLTALFDHGKCAALGATGVNGGHCTLSISKVRLE